MHGGLLQEELTRRIIGAFYEVYNSLGFGFLEAVYANALEQEMRARSLRVDREVWVDVAYKGQKVGQYRADVIVEQSVIVELKAGRLLDPSAQKQLLNYLRGTTLEVGLLLHFGPHPAFKRLVVSNVPEP